MRQEYLPVQGELSSSRSTREEPDAQRCLERSHTLRDRLLRDRQTDRCLLKLARVGDGDERAYALEIHVELPSRLGGRER